MYLNMCQSYSQTRAQKATNNSPSNHQKPLPLLPPAHLLLNLVHISKGVVTLSSRQIKLLKTKLKKIPALLQASLLST